MSILFISLIVVFIGASIWARYSLKCPDRDCSGRLMDAESHKETLFGYVLIVRSLGFSL